MDLTKVAPTPQDQVGWDIEINALIRQMTEANIELEQYASSGPTEES